MGAIAQITEINFPTVTPGEIIAGTVTMMNIGDDYTSYENGWFGVLIKTLWDGGEYERIMYSSTAPGEFIVFDFLNIQGGIGAMPVGDAVIEVTARMRLGDTWRVDDEKNLYLAGEPPAPKPNPLAPLILIAGLVLLFARK